MTVARVLTGAGAAHSWPVIGRDEELERIASLWSNRMSPTAAAVATAGVGKSRPAREADRGRRPGRAMACWVQGTRSAATVPLAASADLVPPEARADDPLLQLPRTARTLREQAAGRPIVIARDDAQGLDPTRRTGEQRARHRIYDSSQGNVLYTHELVRTARTSGGFVSVDGYWRHTHATTAWRRSDGSVEGY
jgi:hypothetical protein